jgi:hypothetical protein
LCVRVGESPRHDTWLTLGELLGGNPKPQTKEVASNMHAVRWRGAPCHLNFLSPFLPVGCSARACVDMSPSVWECGVVCDSFVFLHAVCMRCHQQMVVAGTGYKGLPPYPVAAATSCCCCTLFAPAVSQRCCTFIMLGAMRCTCQTASVLGQV